MTELVGETGLSETSRRGKGLADSRGNTGDTGPPLCAKPVLKQPE